MVLCIKFSIYEHHVFYLISRLRQSKEIRQCRIYVGD